VFSYFFFFFFFQAEDGIRDFHVTGVQTCALPILADLTLRLPNVRFAGVQAYHGGIQHTRSFDERQRAAQQGAEAAAGFVDALRQAGYACEVVTGGGTGTALFDAASGVFTELQPGSYAFMDGDYGA